MANRYDPMMKLRLKRIEAGLSQEALAEKVGVTQNALSLYELGKRFPRRQVLGKLAEVLECDIRDII